MVPATEFALKGKSRDSYLELVVAFPLATIKSAKHLATAQKVMDHLLARKRLDAGERIYLETLSDLVEAYEDQQHPISAPSDAEMLQHLLDAKGINAIQLSRDTGLAKSTISEVLAGKKRFSRGMIRKLAEYFQVDVGVLAANI